MKMKTTLMTMSLMLAMLVLMPASAQADPMNEVTAIVTEEVLPAAEEATDPFGEQSLRYTVVNPRCIAQDVEGFHVKGCAKGGGGGGDEHPNGSPGECNEEPNNIECVCARYPDSPTCTRERVFCDNGQQGWDTDGDGRCDADDRDDDGDGVPDTCDPTNDTNAVDSTYNWVDWWLRGQPSSC